MTGLPKLRRTGPVSWLHIIFCVQAVHKYAPRGPGELRPEEELGLHNYVSKKMPDRLHVAKLIAGYEVCQLRSKSHACFDSDELFSCSAVHRALSQLEWHHDNCAAGALCKKHEHCV